MLNAAFHQHQQHDHLNPTPNNLPVPTSLSPAAQAIVKAFDDRYELLGPLEDDWQEQCLAAALRAAADQVVPEEPLYGGDQRWMFERDARQVSREKLLAIATELKGLQ
jgi:hypothetical protein